MKTTSENLSLFQIDEELDIVVEEMHDLNLANEQLPQTLIDRFQSFCRAYEEKADRIGHFIRVMEFTEQCCRQEAARLLDRARIAEGKVKRTKSMLMYLLMKRGLSKLEGRQFSFRIHANSQDSVRILDDASVPMECRRVQLNLDGTTWETVLSFVPEELATSLQKMIEISLPDTSAIKAALSRNEDIPGVELKRGYHLRVT